MTCKQIIKLAAATAVRDCAKCNVFDKEIATAYADGYADAAHEAGHLTDTEHDAVWHVLHEGNVRDGTDWWNQPIVA